MRAKVGLLVVPLLHAEEHHQADQGEEGDAHGDHHPGLPQEVGDCIHRPGPFQTVGVSWGSGTEGAVPDSTGEGPDRLAVFYLAATADARRGRKKSCPHVMPRHVTTGCYSRM